MILLKSLFLKDQALRFKLSADPRLYAWSWLFLMECTAGKGAPQHVAQTSPRRLFADRPRNRSSRTRRSTTIATSAASSISTATSRRSTRGVEHMKLLESDGQEIKVLDREGVIALEPSLASAKRRSPAASIARPTRPAIPPNSPARSRPRSSRAAAEFAPARQSTGSRRPATGSPQALTDKGAFKGDAYVLALGSESPTAGAQDRARSADLSDQGLFADDPDRQPARPPTIASVDEHNLVAISRFGDRIRVTATAEFAGYDTSHKPIGFRFHEARHARSSIPTAPTTSAPRCGRA